MLKNFKHKFKKNFEIFGLVILIILTAISSSYYNYKKNINQKTYDNIIDNVYLNKTLKYIIENLDPKYKKIKHKIKSGETFDKILENYSIDKEEIIKIKNSLKKKINLNKLNTKQTIQFSIDKTNNKITEFNFQISNKQKIILKRNIEKDSFNEEIVSVKLDKEIIYNENIILQSLYKAASDQKIPANIIIEFARIYGFKLISKEILGNKINFKSYEIFLNEKKEMVETEKFFLLILNLVVKIIVYITLIKVEVRDIMIKMVRA